MVNLQGDLLLAGKSTIHPANKMFVSAV